MSSSILSPSNEVKNQNRVIEQFGEYHVMTFDPPGLVLISKGTPDDIIASFNCRVTEFPDLTSKTAKWLFQNDNTAGPYQGSWDLFVVKAKELCGIEIADKFRPRFVTEESPPVVEPVVEPEVQEEPSMEDEVIEEEVVEAASEEVAPEETNLEPEASITVEAATEVSPEAPVVEEPAPEEPPVEVGLPVSPPPAPLKRNEKIDETERTAQNVLVANGCDGTKTMTGKEIYVQACAANPDMKVKNEGTYQVYLSLLGKDPDSGIQCPGRRQGFYWKK